MNTVNILTGFSPFQLWMGWSPRIIPPLSPAVVKSALLETDSAAVLALIEPINLDVSEEAKFTNQHITNQHRSDEVPYAVGDNIMLLT
ncbi:hypothetical protein PILCRDRAFT_81401 [Piloderma croceum F 1598]|uniref:Uncharacterized protein n=1 Tax=Piloderma croceum (strain F 1598) TaxID=765440 RepID=A0A0C3EZH7_PILCF|nr:hypothetical protein PILCRDRAFT_81401 [Piloderma croceum F 1598]